MKPHHVTILDISNTDIKGESMGTTDLNDYPWKMDAWPKPTQRNTRERVILHELEPREDLSPLYDHEMEENNEESTALKKHSGHGGEVCKRRRPRKRLRGTKGTSIETAIVVDDDDDDDKEIRRSTRTTIPPN
ncbi:hypothetical protein K469DRAFT_744335 [Zopfia rhizophila CBS 207.26]|uniref:Uncharacterized protein n=1 Tax=Zopfia rhizophila CBS 207.26 TaxID=1314779 RepID=A0A6A6F0M5_9PEZI|nr:hypothetical protein K469DRAFT_744335 [Zopfia rhizophila CBS 207.26]